MYETSINLKIRNFNDDPYTIIPVPVCVCVEFCSMPVYGSLIWIDQSRTNMDKFTPGLLSKLTNYMFCENSL